MDLTIEVMLPPRGAADFTLSANPKWRVLSIVAVYPRKKVDVVAMPNTGYIHVADVPTPRGWGVLATDELMRRLNAALADAAEDQEQRLVAKRRWAGEASLLPLEAREKLRSDRQVTISWATFTGAVRDVTNARSLRDVSLDDGDRTALR